MDIVFRGCQVVFLWIVCIVEITQSFPDYQKLIPNGANVPNPCNPSELWEGVGHITGDGGSDRNPFGLDFVGEERTWTSSLCDKDSDGDGLTNGEELGDPYCEWSEGKEPRKKTNLTHPGICEPLDSELCKEKNSWLKCPDKDTFCDAWIEKGTMTKTLRLPVTQIPPRNTTYFCQIFDLPADDDYHLVGTKPVIDNSEITHHILLFGCEDDPSIPDTPRPYACGMVPHPKCIYIIGMWTVGSDGDCFHRNEGFRLGLRGFKRAAMQVHWNNPKKEDFYTDSSGLKLFYTSQRRQFDAGIMAVGQEYLQIPPGRPSTEIDSVCPADCTEKMFKQPIYITRAVNHMHYMGIRQRISLYRNGDFIQDITNDVDYHYDRPKFYSYEPPVKVLPGDEIKTHCTYTSLNKNKTVYFGDGTNDEMCYGFITYYPVQPIAVPFCTTWKSVHKCRRHQPEYGGMYENCKWKDFLFMTDNRTAKLTDTIFYTCANMTCPTQCSESLNEIRRHPCLQGDLGEFMLDRWRATELFAKYVEACDSVGNDAPIYSSNFLLLMLMQIFFIVWKLSI